MKTSRDERYVLSQTGKLQPFLRMTAFSASRSELRSATNCFNRRVPSVVAAALRSRLAASLRFPVIKGRLADPMLPAQVRSPPGAGQDE